MRKTTNKFSPEVRDRAVRLVLDQEGKHPSRSAAITSISAQDVRDLMIATVEQRFGCVNQLPTIIEWLTDNGSCYTARETRRSAREINLRPRTTPIESPQSNGMAEASVRTMKRDYVRVAAKPRPC
ncbi:MAG: DDE-type integrase/transposase/recombinase [Blastomonas sp.]|jgi:putative transposase|nr:DDE-type integrase/transposase/recombinase [Blastomonas sp.]